MESIVQDVVDDAVEKHCNDERSDRAQRRTEPKRDEANDKADKHHGNGEQKLISEGSCVLETLDVMCHVNDVQASCPSLMEAPMDHVTHHADCCEVDAREKQRLDHVRIPCNPKSRPEAS